MIADVGPAARYLIEEGTARCAGLVMHGLQVNSLCCDSPGNGPGRGHLSPCGIRQQLD